ncbi:DUF6745 domain-containing protein [Micromonospora sp. NPDC005707]|uniref:DUF6745 domain-containing protein n=1 Tax=Micromonospora sp. NPDC005707 TaxID=3157050 RepID=UPI0034114FBB
MSARNRQRARRRAGSHRNLTDQLDRWYRAAELRDGWLRSALSTEPADRDRAERALTGLYARLGRPRPRFHWVASPRQAVDLLDEPPIRYGGPTDPDLPWHLARQLADEVHGLRRRLDDRTRSAGEPPWWVGRSPLVATRPPAEALDAGARLDDLLDTGVRDSLHRTVRDGIRAVVRNGLVAEVPEPPGLRWHGQHDVAWLAHYDVRRQLRPGRYDPDDDRHLDLWAEAARSCGWWWPREGVCVVTERTTVAHTEPVPGAHHGERRSHNGHGPAVGYADGTGGHAWHGIAVPEWVVHDPTVERIARERNVEVRRCAIEHLGWDAYLAEARLRLLAEAPDPGNPGCRLQLYDLPRQVWGRPARVLLAVNGSVERDGRRRRYGLTVPDHLDDPVAAAGWSYGLTGDQYARLLRRT